jgi:hypothetical protein
MDRASAPASSSAGLDVTDNRSAPLTLVLNPHIEERNGCPFHLDRFDAYLDGELILTSRQPWHDGARELLRRGYPGDTLLTVRHAGRDFDNSVPLEISYLAQWSISDSARGGLKRIRWQPMPEYLKRQSPVKDDFRALRVTASGEADTVMSRN